MYYEPMVRIVLEDDDASGRHCGGCTLCCRLLPIKAAAYPRERIGNAVNEMIAQGFAKPADFAGMMPEFDKPAGKPCPHQRHHKGCTVYRRRPFGCRMWSCRWLTNVDTADLRRPDRSRVVIDVMPDFVTLTTDEGQRANIEVVQLWVDPATPDAWREPSILAYLERRAAEGIAALIRFDSHDAVTVFAPALSQDGQWHEVRGQSHGEHLGRELYEGLARAQKVKVAPQSG